MENESAAPELASNAFVRSNVTPFPAQETRELARFLSPFAKGIAMSGDKDLALKLERCAYWLEKLSHNICGKGFIGCHGGMACDSDHK